MRGRRAKQKKTEGEAAFAPATGRFGQAASGPRRAARTLASRHSPVNIRPFFQRAPRVESRLNIAARRCGGLLSVPRWLVGEMQTM